MYKKGSEKHLSEKENEITTKENEGEGSVLDNILLSFEYNVKNSEEEQAFKAFQKKYVYKSNIIKTCLFGAAALLFLISFIRAPKEYLNPVLMFISMAVIFVIWFNTFKIRKSLLQALKMLENDRYIFTLYDDRFSIETIIDESEFGEDEEIPVVQPRVVYFDNTDIHVIEQTEMFILILKKDTIYVLPKRCFDENVSKELYEKLQSTLGEEYESQIK